MIVVLDTNALLVSIPKRSLFRPVFDALISGKFQIVISNEILSEYVEIIEQKANALVAGNIAEMLLNLRNVIKADIYFEWSLITGDPDDNKYVDAAVVGSADYIVTNDHHFSALKSIGFPKVKTIGISDFLDLILADQI